MFEDQNNKSVQGQVRVQALALVPCFILSADDATRCNCKEQA